MTSKEGSLVSIALTLAAQGKRFEDKTAFRQALADHQSLDLKSVLSPKHLFEAYQEAQEQSSFPKEASDAETKPSAKAPAFDFKSKVYQLAKEDGSSERIFFRMDSPKAVIFQNFVPKADLTYKVQVDKDSSIEVTLAEAKTAAESDPIGKRGDLTNLDIYTKVFMQANN